MLEHTQADGQCFGRLKARELSAEEVMSISGGCNSSVTAGDTGITIDELSDGYLFTGDDGD